MDPQSSRSRPPLVRVLHIHRRLEAHQAPNCTTLARELEVTPKTIQRDIEWMRNRWNAPIAYDAAEHAFYYSETFVDLPLIPVTEGELLSLFVASQALASYRGTPFERPLRSAFQKLSAGLPQSFTVDLASLGTALSFHQTGAAETDLETFQTLSEAVRRSVEIRFRYHKLEAEAPEERHVRPYHLACVNHLWYLLAFDLDRQALRRFALPRIHPPLSSGNAFERPADFSPADELRRSFTVFSGEGDYTIRLAFSPFAARLVRERVWHRSQHLRDRADGSLEMTLNLSALEEITAWVLGWGTHCRVLAPEPLRTRVRATLASAASLYDQTEATWPATTQTSTANPAQLHLPLHLS